ncbi:MAG TPA: YfiR family protein [Schlesneria sp.]|jgi:hypothetical protein
MSSVIHPVEMEQLFGNRIEKPSKPVSASPYMQELSWPAKSVLMAAATLMIGFSALGACRGSDARTTSRMIARGDSSLAYSALSYITWPKESFEAENSPFVMAVLGKVSSAHEKLQAPYLEGKKRIQGRIVEIRKYDSPDEVTNSHMLLVAESYPQKLASRALEVVGGKSVLTIGETDTFAKAGGVLSIVKSGDSSLLELSQRAAAKQRLKVDVRLVNVSVLVDEDRGR